MRATKSAHWLAVLLIAVAGLIVSAQPAHAAPTRMIIGPGLASCPAGYVCLWTLNDFTGTGYAFFNSEVDYLTLPAPFNGIQDWSWSFYSHGNTHDIKFYRAAGQAGNGFILCRGEAIGRLPSNGEVSPPGAWEPGQGWRDVVSSHKFGWWC